MVNLDIKNGEVKATPILFRTAAATAGVLAIGLGIWALRAIDKIDEDTVNNYDHTRPAIYHVQSGDTLDKIAIRVRDQAGLNLDYRLIRDEILEINGSGSKAFRREYLIAGEDLKVPSYKNNKQ